MKIVISSKEDSSDIPQSEGVFGSLDLARREALRCADLRQDGTESVTMLLTDECGQVTEVVVPGRPEPVVIPDESEEKKESSTKGEAKKGRKKKK